MRQRRRARRSSRNLLLLLRQTLLRSRLRRSSLSLKREVKADLQEAKTECLASSSPEFELNPFLEKSSPKQPLQSRRLKHQRLKHPLRPVLWHPLRLVPALLSLLPLALYIARLLLNSSASETSCSVRNELLLQKDTLLNCTRGSEILERVECFFFFLHKCSWVLTILSACP
jgi:hypothetical protein